MVMRLDNKIYLPPDHKLIERGSAEDGHAGEGEYRFFDELDGSGEVVARYEYYYCCMRMPPFSIHTGYRKFDLQENMIEEEQF